MRFAFLGLSLTSAWGNGHATTYRGLLRALAARGHEILFLERDVPWYAPHRDLPAPDFCRIALYADRAELERRHADAVREADCVVLGSYVPEGVPVGRWILSAARGVVAFYDIDTPVTLRRLEEGDEEYLSRDLVPRFDLYLSFSGGRALERLEEEFGARRARALYCSADPAEYRPEPNGSPEWDLGYLGTYSEDRQPVLDELLLRPARGWREGRFAVAGPRYPEDVAWPPNVRRIDHLPPPRHRWFYNNQRFTLNATREAMTRLGHSPSVRLFEAAACGTPVISDRWDGLDEFFRPGEEILVSDSAAEVERLLREVDGPERDRMGRAARRRVQEEHTPAHRAGALEEYVRQVRP